MKERAGIFRLQQQMWGKQVGSLDEMELLERLHRANPIERKLAAQRLGRCGSAAVLPLCGALEDPYPEVRLEAAHSLGRLGDPRAITPLTEALRQCLDHGSAWFHFLTGMGLLLAGIVGFVPLLALCLVGALWSGDGCLLALPLQYWGWISEHFTSRRQQSRFCLAYTEALAQIAERRPTMELRALVPELDALSLDLLQQDRQTRDASKYAAERIKVLTDRIKDLPLPSASHADEPATLPLPAQAATIPQESLPRV